MTNKFNCARNHLTNFSASAIVCWSAQVDITLTSNLRRATMPHNTHQNFITYSARGSETTTSIKEAPLSVQNLWFEGSRIGASIIRVRSRKNREGYSSGNTFHAYHKGRTSVYIPKAKADQKQKLGFKKNVDVGIINPTMQILEMPISCDIQPCFEAVREASTGNKLYNAIFS